MLQFLERFGWFVLGYLFCLLTFLMAARANGQALPIEPTKNRITVYGGYGPDGLRTANTDHGLKVTANFEPLWGLGYSRKVYEDWSLSTQFLTGVSPQTATFLGLVGVGYDW